jgi:tripeptidyl-peptidase-2
LLACCLSQVPAAHKLLQTYATASQAASLTMDVCIPARNGARGLYLREPTQTERTTAVTVQVTPQFHTECNNEDKVRFEVQVVLRSTAAWCAVPGALVLNASGKGFEAVVDPSALAVGEAHFCEVQGLDANAPHLGPIFRFPVTVIKPKRLQEPGSSGVPGDATLALPQRRYSPGAIDRHFVAVPEGASWAELTFKTREVEGAHMLVLHALQVLPASPATGRNKTEIEKYIRLKPFHTVKEQVNVVGGMTLELCLCKWWASLGSVEVDVELVFHGLEVSSTSLFLGTDEPGELFVSAPLRAEEVSVSSKLSTLRKALVPCKHVLRQPMDARNMLPQQRFIYELELSYEFEQTEKEVVKVLPRAPMYQLLYDSPFEAQLWMVYDANKQLMGTGDALYPYPMTLPKGKYTMQLLVRHDNKALLDKLKSLVVPVDFTLAKDLSVPVHTSLHDALIGQNKYSSGALARGSRLKLFVAPPPDKVPGAKHGDVLLGAVQVGQTECALQVLVPKEAAKEESKDKDKSEGKSDAEVEREEVRDARLKRLKKLREDRKWESFDALAAALLADSPGHLPVLEEVLSRRDTKADEGETNEAKQARCVEAIKAARAIEDAVDVAALAQHYGVKHEADDPEEKEACKKMDKKKEALLAARLCAVERFLEMLGPAPSCEAGEGMSLGLGSVLVEGKSAIETLLVLWGAVQKLWVATDQGFDDKIRHVRLLSQVRRREGRPGVAGAELLKMIKSNEGAPNKAVVLEMMELCKQMGWGHWVAYYEDLLLKFFPAKYALI